MTSPSRSWTSAVYWLAVLASIVAGAILWSSFGQALVLFGVLLAALAPMRREPRVFWPLAAGLVVFLGGYAATAPANCRTGAVADVEGNQAPGRFCDSLVGFDYERLGTEDPSDVPAFAGALGAGLVVAGGLRLITRRGERREEQRPPWEREAG